MKKQETQKHFLALMKRPGDYVFIDISRLDIASNYRPNFLADIDSFTMCFTKEEIMNSIKRCNVVSNIYLSGKLVIQDNQKHNPLEVIDREYYDNFRLDIYLKNKMKDKVKLNNILNKFNSIVKDDECKKMFNIAMKSDNLRLAIDVLLNLPYLELRKYMIYLINLRNKERELQKEMELIRDKVA